MKNRSNLNNSVVSEWEDNILFDADDPDFCNLSPAVANVVLNTAASPAALTTVVVGTPEKSSFLMAHQQAHQLFGSPLTTTIMTASGVQIKVPQQSPVTRAIQIERRSTANSTTTTMSLASVHGPTQITDLYSPLGRSSISMSSSLNDLVGSPLEISVDNVLTIEELRQHMGSCFTCGVSWTDDHVSLDCSECGGYSLERPCPLCDGQCGVLWKRDFTMSHACSKARWHGVCPSYPAALMNAANAVSANATITSNAPASSCASAAATQLRLAQELRARLEQLSASAHT